ncbi:MAG: formylglycine-generating enzyme family protein [Prevotellaceae bacterium]|jgi:hypothetical protein|nr:formylglycine-generating enzyme family protein [Prevotellaceae bacterium]
MKRLKFTAIALFFSLMMVFGQEPDGILSGSFSGKAKYTAGKNSYLLDECKVDYTYKMILGSPVYVANMTWKRKDDFTVKNEKISYKELEAYPDLQKRFALLTPVNVKFYFTVLFYSNQMNSYIASAKSEITVIPEKAGYAEEMLTIPRTETWTKMFSDAVAGKQEQKAPGVVIPNEALENYFKLERIKYGKLDKNTRGFGRAMRHIFALTNRMEVVNVEVDAEWNEADYAYIAEEYNKRKNAAKMADKQKADEAYYSNRTFAPTISENDPDFWNTTIPPYENWMKAVDEADALYAKKLWADARVYYKKAAETAPSFSYPAQRIEKIQKYMDHRASRNVGDLELIYVEGSGDVKSFYIGKTEITQGQWRRVMNSNPSGFGRCPTCPVEKVSWEEAQEFLKKLNQQTGMKYRLPKLDEWEYAAKGGKKSLRTQFSGSDNMGEVAWCAYNSEEGTHPVAQKAPNELGIYDMTGNVSEWIANLYDKNIRFIKGGSWSDDAANSIISKNETYHVNHKNNHIGFRVCQDE